MGCENKLNSYFVLFFFYIVYLHGRYKAMDAIVIGSNIKKQYIIGNFIMEVKFLTFSFWSYEGNHDFP